MENLKPSEEERVFKTILRLDAKVMGLVLGLLFGLALFIATNWLIIKGGHVTSKGEYVVGPHLQLLGQFFPGYKVTFSGSIVGFFYGFGTGAFCGAFTGWIYNRIVDFKSHS